MYLGISVKGKTSSNIMNNKDVSQDLGIFIKNVIHGGAASRYIDINFNNNNIQLIKIMFFLEMVDYVQMINFYI